MKIVFFGTPDFAVPSLEILIESGYQVVAVVTAPGKPAGRGLEIRQPPVRLAAEKHGLKILQPTKLTDHGFIDELSVLDAQLFIVVAFRMLPEIVWQMPSLGTFNLHASLLPQYRGAAPINRAIMNGETVTGLTTFFLRHEIDTGNIIFAESLAIGPDETAGELHDRMMQLGAGLVLKTVRAIEKGGLAVTPQSQFTDQLALKPAPRIFSNDCRIEWHQSARTIHNLVRGLSPFPGAYTTLVDAGGNRMKIKIYASGLTTHGSVDEPGTIRLSGNRMFIACADDLLEITELQQEGKKRMNTAAFLPGFRKEKQWRAISEN